MKNHWLLIPQKINKLHKEGKITAKQTLFLGLILGLSSEKGYCYASNSYLAEEIGIKNKQTITNWLVDLQKKGLVKVEILQNQEGKILERRIYPLFFVEDTPPKSYDLYPPKSYDLVDKYNNDIFIKNKNSINTKKAKAYGNGKVNLVLEEFKKHKGYYPTDRNPRRRAWNIVQRIETFLKKHPILIEKYNFTFEIMLQKFFNTLKNKDYWEKIETLDACRRKLNIFFGALEKKLKNLEIIEKFSEETKSSIKVPKVDSEKLKQIKEKVIKKMSF